MACGVRPTRGGRRRKEYHEFRDQAAAVLAELLPLQRKVEKTKRQQATLERALRGDDQKQVLVGRPVVLTARGSCGILTLVVVCCRSP